MLPKKYRLSSEKDILRLLRAGRLLSSGHLTLRFAPNSLTVARFGFVVSKKIHNKSAKRNLPKKQLRHIIALHLRQIAPGRDYLFSAKPKILELDYQALEQDAGELLARAGAIKT